LIESIKIKAKKKILTRARAASAKAKSSGKSKSQAQKRSQAAKPSSLIGKIDIIDLNVDLDILDAKVSALVSLSLNLPDKKLSFLNVNAKQLNVGMISLRGVNLNALQGQRGKGSLKIRQADLGRLKIRYIKSKAVLEGMILSLDGIAGRFLSKKITGEATLNLWPILECTANARVVGISAAALAKELGWEDKISLSGRLYAKAIFRSEGKAMAMLNINFISSPAGAALTISDPWVLQRISRRTRQPLANVRESFREYGFKRGQLIGSLLEDALSLKIILDGQQGRRNLNFDFKGVNIFGAN
jgi:hypothetical protein